MQALGWTKVRLRVSIKSGDWKRWIQHCKLLALRYLSVEFSCVFEDVSILQYEHVVRVLLLHLGSYNFCSSEHMSALWVYYSTAPLYTFKQNTLSNLIAPKEYKFQQEFHQFPSSNATRTEVAPFFELFFEIIIFYLQLNFELFKNNFKKIVGQPKM